jgi:hypothetical protein
MQVMFWMMVCGFDLKNKETGFEKKKSRIIKKNCEDFTSGTVLTDAKSDAFTSVKISRQM